MGFSRSVSAALVVLTGACVGGGASFSPATTLSTTTSVGTAPMVAVSPAGLVAYAWVSAPAGGIDGRLYVSIADAAPVELRDSLGPVEGKGESPPKIAYGVDGSVNAIYVVDKDVPTARQPLEALRFIRSTDGGKSWSTPRTITDDSTFGAHNFHSLHVTKDGTIYVSWLGGEGGKPSVWVTRSADQGNTWSTSVSIDSGTVCDCCRTNLASGPDGSLYVAWRHVFDGNMRDVVVARSADSGRTWSEPVRVHADGWSFNGCPRAGPSIQVDSAGRVHVAWWTGKAGGAGVWYARSDNNGKSFSAPTPLGVADVSRPAHVQLAVGAGGLVAAAWDDGTQSPSRILFRESRDGGATFGRAEALSAAGRTAGYPVLAVTATAITATWSEGGAPPAIAPKPAPAESAGMDHKAHRGIKPIGDAQVVMRRAPIRGRE